jgi:hypothetical protein
VQHQWNRSGAFTALMLAAALSGCANVNTFDQNERWFAKPFDWTGQSGGYSFSELKDTQDKQSSVAPADLVSANGACPPAPAAAMPGPAAEGPGVMPVAQAEGPQAMPTGPGAMPTAPSDDPLLGQGIGLGMTECDVVWRAGTPSSVQIGGDPNGTRTAVLTFNSGPRAGIYRFEAGRLADMDGIQTTEAVPQTTKRVARKRPQPAQSEQISTE